MRRTRAFPLVDNRENMILLGSVTKRRLWQLLDSQASSSWGARRSNGDNA